MIRAMRLCFFELCFYRSGTDKAENFTDPVPTGFFDIKIKDIWGK